MYEASEVKASGSSHQKVGLNLWATACQEDRCNRYLGLLGKKVGILKLSLEESESYASLGKPGSVHEVVQSGTKKEGLSAWESAC